MNFVNVFINYTVEYPVRLLLLIIIIIYFSYKWVFTRWQWYCISEAGNIDEWNKETIIIRRKSLTVSREMSSKRLKKQHTNTYVTQNNTPRSNKTQHTKLHK
jgi:hypothetical protein